jgi:hypothetical protein
MKETIQERNKRCSGMTMYEIIKESHVTGREEDE